MSIHRLSHIGSCVSHLATSVSFYRTLGFEELSRLTVQGQQSAQLLAIEGGALQAVYLERDGTRLELLYYPTAGHRQDAVPCPMNRLGFTHLSLRVEQIDETITRVEEAGGTVLAETRVDNPDWHSSAVFVTDPDGLRIELLQAPGDPNALPSG